MVRGRIASHRVAHFEHLSFAVGLSLAALFVACPGSCAQAQGRPTGDGRIWGEIGISAARQTHRCVTCSDDAAIGGASLTGSAGVTLTHGLGVGLLARSFHQFDFESWLNSRYVVALAQYTPRRLTPLTLDAGGGWGRYSGEGADAANNGTGAVVYASVALRMPPGGALALCVTADVIQSVSGAPSTHPRLLSVGIAIGAASAPVGAP